MYNNKISKESIGLTNKKRGLNNSLTEDQISPDKDTKSKAVKMTEPADKEDIEEIKKLISTNTKMINESIATLTSNIASLSSQIVSINDKVQNIEERVTLLEEDNAKDKQEMADIRAELNAINQIKLESQLSILNVPRNIEPKQALQNISIWAGCQLNDSNVRRATVVKPKDKLTAILQLDFYDLSAKTRLMKNVKKKQRDENKKYTPILTEFIFNVDPTDAAIGKELNFREQFTEMNRGIFNAARKHKDILDGVWISRGYINVKHGNGNAIRIKSIDELNELVKTLKHSSNQHS